MAKLLIAGSGEDLYQDFEHFMYDYGESGYHETDICVVNGVVGDWPFKINAMATIHTDQFLPLVKETVPKLIYRPPLSDAKKALELIPYESYLGGSSGGLALTWGLQNYDNIFLVGIPLEGRNRFHGGAKYEYYHNFWTRDFSKYKDRVKSYSGWTKSFFIGGF